VPVLEKMLENSRDEAHRADLARVLLRLGRVQHIPELVRSDDFEWGISRYLKDSSPTVRADALRVLAQLPSADYRSQWFAALGRLQLGSIERLDDDLRLLQEPAGEEYRVQWLPCDLHANPENALAFRERLPTIAERSMQHYSGVMQSLLRYSPELVRRDDLEPLRSLRDATPEFLMAFLFASRREDALWLLEGPNAPLLLERLQRDQNMDGTRLGVDGWRLELEKVPVAQRARILSATKSTRELLELALAEREAVRVFGELLTQWDLNDGGKETVNELAGLFRLDGVPSSNRGRSQPVRALVPGELEPTPRPPTISPELEAEMERVFRSGVPPRNAAIALELLLRAYPNGRAETFELFRSVLEDKAADPAHRIIALLGALLRLPDHEEQRDEVMVLVDAAYEETQAEGWWERVGVQVNQDIWNLAIGLSWIGVRRDMRGSTSQAIGDYLWLLESERGSFALAERCSVALTPSLPRGRGISLRRVLRASVGSNSAGARGYAAFDEPLAASVDDITDPGDLRALADAILSLSWHIHEPIPVSAWTRLAQDPEVHPNTRVTFLQNLAATDLLQLGIRQQFLRDLDWRALLIGDDPIALSLIGSEPLREYIWPHRFAARASPQIAMQRWAWQDAALPETPEDLAPALDSSDPNVRLLAYDCLLLADDTRWLPLLHRAAQEGPTDLRDDAIDRLAFFAAEESLPVLTALLDDPVFAVRARALEALEKIEATLSQQEKWRERFGKKKKG